MTAPRARSLTAGFTVLAACGVGVRPVAAGAQPTAARPNTLVLTLDDAFRRAEAASIPLGLSRAALRRATGVERQTASAERPQAGLALDYTRNLRTQFDGLSNATSSPAGGSVCAPPIAADAGHGARDSALARAVTCPPVDLTRYGFGSPHQYGATLTLSQPLFQGGRLAATTRSARATQRAAALDVVTTRAQLRLDVASAYDDAVVQDALVDVAEHQLAAAALGARELRAQHTAGTQLSAAVVQATAAVADARRALVSADGARQLALLTLRQLVGVDDDVPVALATRLDGVGAPAGPQGGLPQGGPADDGARTAVREAAYAVEAQRAALAAARAERWPSVGLVARVGQVAFPSDGALPTRADWRANVSVGLSIDYALSTGGRRRGDVDVALAGAEDATLRLRQAREQAALDRRRALVGVATAEAASQAAAEDAAAADAAYRVTLVRRTEGAALEGVLASTAAAARQAEAGRLDAARTLHLARLRLTLLPDLPLGGGAQPPAAPAPGAGASPPPPTENAPGAPAAGPAVASAPGPPAG
ncbi:transporter [Gemmatimonadetes bacterium T265]|nr:transporter [Gemmatimonadetes bacterium T265]